MVTLFLIAFIICFLFWGLFRFILFNIHNIAYYSPKDFIERIKYKKSNICPNYGYIKIYNGYFGSGKSLSCVQEVISIYKKYNGLTVYDKDLKQFVKQKITIISNLTLFGVPYVPFTSEQQFIDYETVPGEVVIFLIDEIGTVWNNRNFKEFNPDVFKNIVQSRKRKMAIYGTLPLLVGVDINVRRFTDTVVVCKKWWRIVKQTYYNGSDVENCSNVDMLQPLCIKYLFVKDLYYYQYDTVELVDKLKKDMEDGNLLTFNELNIEDGKSDIKQARLKRKYKNRQKG